MKEIHVEQVAKDRYQVVGDIVALALKDADNM